jgi:hypothetical protein
MRSWTCAPALDSGIAFAPILSAFLENVLEDGGTMEAVA